eukprot:TRINITY_DN11726_c0_g1_i1.p1 TRINITY_DN11726_c0_g1~~TRINITY_DN11726_c0_g1_i1.p1  ORF type:complete len:568 (+),score=174.60 TRINITY_DN11726_c0_g1_i1:59-1705(+)
MPGRKAASAVHHAVDASRVRALNKHPRGGGPVAYWMERDQRTQDNWALLYAQQLAVAQKVPLAVVHGLAPGRYTARQSAFALAGLEETAGRLQTLGIPLFVFNKAPAVDVAGFVAEHGVGTLVVDYSPLRAERAWRAEVAAAAACAVEEVDARNIVPVWVASPKIEYAARTFRTKVNAQLKTYLTAFPEVQNHPVKWAGGTPEVDWAALGSLPKAPGAAVPPVTWLAPGEGAAHKHLAAFVAQRLKGYGGRNDPNAGAQSDLSPYLHFGQLSAQRVALAVQGARVPTGDFLEELVVRREVTDNYCHYNPDGYDRLDGLYPQFENQSWAQKSLKAHAKDKREYVYSEQQLETAATHDDLWNAAQMELVHRGKMHGFMRMYWAKKILEWTTSPHEALGIALYLNDHYSLDGCDPNGFVGCAWAIAGVHDMGWAERPVFGKIRYMNYAGCQRKFDVPKYIARVAAEAEGATKDGGNKRRAEADVSAAPAAKKQKVEVAPLANPGLRYDYDEWKADTARKQFTARQIGPSKGLRKDDLLKRIKRHDAKSKAK